MNGQTSSAPASAARLRDVHAVALVNLAPGTVEPAGWRRGPAPVSVDGPGEPYVADVPRRRSYLADRVCSVLYGRDGDARSHAPMTNPLETSVPGLSVAAVELWAPADRDLGRVALVHFRVADGPPGDVTRTVASLVRRDGVPGPATSIRTVLTAFPGLEPMKQGRPRLITYARIDTPCPPAWPLDDVAPQRTWQFALAAAVDPSMMAVTADTIASGTVLQPSAVWSALVLRDGVGFLADGSTADGFLDGAAGLVRSIYTDIVLLGHVQEAVLERLVARLALLEDPAAQLDGLLDVERAITRYRSALWHERVTHRGFGNELIGAVHEQLGTLSQLERTLDELADYSRQARLQADIARREAQARQEDEDRRRAASDRRRARALEVLAAVGIPLAFASSLAELSGLSGERLVIAVLAGLVALVAVIVALRRR